MTKLTTADRLRVRKAMIEEGYFTPANQPDARFLLGAWDVQQRIENPDSPSYPDAWRRLMKVATAAEVLAFTESYLKNVRPNRNPRAEQHRKRQYDQPAARRGGGRLGEILSSKKAPAGYVH